MPYDDGTAYLTLVQVEYSEGDSETYAVPLAFAQGDEAGVVESKLGDAIIAHQRVRQQQEQNYKRPQLR